MAKSHYLEGFNRFFTIEAFLGGIAKMMKLIFIFVLV